MYVLEEEVLIRQVQPTQINQGEDTMEEGMLRIVAVAVAVLRTLQRLQDC